MTNQMVNFWCKIFSSLQIYLTKYEIKARLAIANRVSYEKIAVNKVSSRKLCHRVWIDLNFLNGKGESNLTNCQHCWLTTNKFGFRSKIGKDIWRGKYNISRWGWVKISSLFHFCCWDTPSNKNLRHDV